MHLFHYTKLTKLTKPTKFSDKTETNKHQNRAETLTADPTDPMLPAGDGEGRGDRGDGVPLAWFQLTAAAAIGVLLVE